MPDRDCGQSTCGYRPRSGTFCGSARSCRALHKLSGDRIARPLARWGGHRAGRGLAAWLRLLVLLDAPPQRLHEVDHLTGSREARLLPRCFTGLPGLEMGDERLLVTVPERRGIEAASFAVEDVLGQAEHV